MLPLGITLENTKYLITKEDKLNILNELEKKNGITKSFLYVEDSDKIAHDKLKAIDEIVRKLKRKYELK